MAESSTYGPVLRNLGKVRQEKSYSMNELAVAAGVTKTTILRAEHGYPVHPRTARLIASVLGVTVPELVGQAEE